MVVILRLIAVALLALGVIGHRAENKADQYKVYQSMSLEEEERERIENQIKASKQRAKMEAWENETDPTKRFRLYLERFQVELTVLAIMLVCGTHFFIGRMINRRLAFQWLNQVEQVLSNSFSYIPEDCKSDDGSSIATFEDCTSREFPISLSGRESLKYASFNLVTKPRHDIAQSLFTSIPLVKLLFESTRDILWVEMPIERKQVVSSEMLFVQQKEIKTVQAAQPHLKHLLSTVVPNTTSSKKVAPGLVCLAENQESVDSIFSDANILDCFADAQIANYLVTLHITDQRLYKNFPLMLKVQVHANSKAVQHHAKIAKFLIYLADYLSVKYKVAHQVQERTLQRRKKKLAAANEEEAKKQESAKKKK